MTSICQLHAREILDSRGLPTVEAEVGLASGARGRAAVPSGASTGQWEALERRDGGDRYLGRGVLEVVGSITGEIAEAVVGREAGDQRGLDAALCDLDGTDGKRRLGANAVLAVSMATARAAALEAGQPLYRYLGGVDAHVLPVPFLNVLNGGAHAANALDVQEMMIVPVGAASFSEALRWGAEVYQALRALLAQRGLATAVGDEGGFAPDLGATEDGLELLVTAVEAAGLRPGADVALALDVAANELRHDGGYRLEGRQCTGAELVATLARLQRSFPVVSIEDGVADDDTAGWQALTAELGHDAQLVGDDVFVTSPERLAEGIAAGVASAVLVKLNQVGTLTETLATVALARSHAYGAMVSHRSGETEDTFVADLAVATNVGQLKAGAPCRTERVAKYNQLLRIEEELGDAAAYPGSGALVRRPGGAAP